MRWETEITFERRWLDMMTVTTTSPHWPKQIDVSLCVCIHFGLKFVNIMRHFRFVKWLKNLFSERILLWTCSDSQPVGRRNVECIQTRMTSTFAIAHIHCGAHAALTTSLELPRWSLTIPEYCYVCFACAQTLYTMCVVGGVENGCCYFARVNFNFLACGQHSNNIFNTRFIRCNRFFLARLKSLSWNIPSIKIHEKFGAQASWTRKCATTSKMLWCQLSMVVNEYRAKFKSFTTQNVHIRH